MNGRICKVISSGRESAPRSVLAGMLAVAGALLLALCLAGCSISTSISDSVSSPFKIALAAPLCNAAGREGDILSRTIPLGLAVSFLTGVFTLILGWMR